MNILNCVDIDKNKIQQLQQNISKVVTQLNNMYRFCEIYYMERPKNNVDRFIKSEQFERYLTHTLCNYGIYTKMVFSLPWDLDIHIELPNKTKEIFKVSLKSQNFKKAKHKENTMFRFTQANKMGNNKDKSLWLKEIEEMLSGKVGLMFNYHYDKNNIYMGYVDCFLHGFNGLNIEDNQSEVTICIPFSLSHPNIILCGRTYYNNSNNIYNKELKMNLRNYKKIHEDLQKKDDLAFLGCFNNTDFSNWVTNWNLKNP